MGRRAPVPSPVRHVSPAARVMPTRPHRATQRERVRCMGGCWSSDGRASVDTHTGPLARCPTCTLQSVELEVASVSCPGEQSWLVFSSVRRVERCDDRVSGAGPRGRRRSRARPIGVRPALRHGSTTVKNQGMASAGQPACYAIIAKFDIIASQPATILITAHHRHCLRWTTRAHGLEQRRDELGGQSGAVGLRHRQHRLHRQYRQPSCRRRQPPIVLARRSGALAGARQRRAGRRVSHQPTLVPCQPNRQPRCQPQTLAGRERAGRDLMARKSQSNLSTAAG